MKLKTALLLSSTVLLTLATSADVVLPSAVGSNMVLQRDKPIPIWGKAEPGEAVSIKLNDVKIDAVADHEGNWSVTLPAMEASFTPVTMLIAGNNTIELTNILVGEVWVCSGQSNMEWNMYQAHNATLELLAANHPNLRLLRFEDKSSETPLFRTNATWCATTPESVRRFSAVGYFFGRFIQQALDVPVGLIHIAWGGTPAEAWTREEALEKNEVTQEILKKWDIELKTYPERLKEWEQAVEDWDENAEHVIYHTDPGSSEDTKNFPNTDFDDSTWGTSILPATWETKLGNFDGIVWYRKRIEIPQAWANKSLVLETGPIDDFDVTYFNGKEVGRYEEDQGYMMPRSYTIPAELVQSGEAMITIRAFDHFGDGGLNGVATQYKLTCLDTEEELSLAGNWKHHIELKLVPSIGPGKNGAPQKPRGPDSPLRPANLANGMVSPIVPFAIRGAIWYQGEQNVMIPDEYYALLPLLISDWRDWWKQGDFPFGVVQLANFMETEETPSDGSWARLRDAQFQTAKADPATGLTVIIDVGESDDIHPKNKQEVGARLARWALADAYGLDIVGSGPMFQSFSIEGDHVVCIFSEIAEGLEIRGPGDLHEFTIIGEDGIWKWANAEIIGTDRVKVWSDEVPNPVAVRYGWANNPANPNLVNSENLPASPFRTDEWLQGKTTP